MKNFRKLAAKFQIALELGAWLSSINFIETQNCLGQTLIRGYVPKKGYSSQYKY